MLQYLKWEPLAERRTKARLIIHCALASCGAVYCNRSCLWVCNGRAVGRAGGQPTRAQCLRLSERFFITYRIIKGEIAIPIDTADLQPGRRGRFIQHTHRYQQYKNSFYPRTISDWNLLPSRLKDSATLDSFKNRLLVCYSVLLSRPFFRSRDQDRDLDKMNSSALQSRDHGLEITTLAASIKIGDRALA